MVVKIPCELLCVIKVKGFLNQARAGRQAGARLVYRNHFCADVCVCVCVCVCVDVCVSAPEAME